LLPRNEEFFELLVGHVRIVLDASSTLANCLRNGSETGEAARKVRDLERKGDEELRKIYRLLHQSFITPIDPEDIQRIASLSDHILDHLDAAAWRIDAYGMERSLPQISEAAGMLHECIQATCAAIETLQREGVSKPDELTKQCEEVKRRELAAEDRLRTVIRDLFANERDAIQLIKQKEIYDLLEATGDRCENLADTLEAVAVKNS
jgi:hypothetical protein